MRFELFFLLYRWSLAVQRWNDPYTEILMQPCHWIHKASTGNERANLAIEGGLFTGEEDIRDLYYFKVEVWRVGSPESGQFFMHVNGNECINKRFEI